MEKFTVLLATLAVFIFFVGLCGCQQTQSQSKSQDRIPPLSENCTRLEVQNITHDHKEHIVAQVIRALESRNFRLAEKNLLHLNGDGIEFDVNFIVRKVYANNAANFDILATFCEAIADCDHTFHALKALIYEIKTNSYYTNDQLLRLGRVFQAKSCVHSEVNALAILSSVVQLLLRKYYSTELDNSQAAEIANLDGDGAAFKAEIVPLVGRLYNSIGFEEVLSIINRGPAGTARMMSYAALIEAVNISSITTERMFTLAQAIRFNCHPEDGVSLLEREQQICNKLKGILMQKLPISRYNILFSNQVCLWSKRDEMYLYKSTKIFKTPYAWVVEKSGYETKYNFRLNNGYSYLNVDPSNVLSISAKDTQWEIKSPFYGETDGYVHLVTKGKSYQYLCSSGGHSAFVRDQLFKECLWSIMECQ